MDDKDIVLQLRLRSDHVSGPAADYISRLEAVVREVAMEESDITEAPHGYDNCEAHAWVAGWNACRERVESARSRVTIPPLTQTNQAKDGDEEVSDGKA